MAEMNDTSTKRADEGAPGANQLEMTPDTDSSIARAVAKMLAPVFAVQALIQGASALLQAYEGRGEDPNGELWATMELLEEALNKAREILTTEERLDIFSRIEVLEGGAA